jgi:hypothetical protein
MFSWPTCAALIAFGCSIAVKHNLLRDALLSKDHQLLNRKRSMISRQIRMQSKEFADFVQQYNTANTKYFKINFRNAMRPEFQKRCLNPNECSGLWKRQINFRNAMPWRVRNVRKPQTAASLIMFFVWFVYDFVCFPDLFYDFLYIPLFVCDFLMIFMVLSDVRLILKWFRLNFL